MSSIDEHCLSHSARAWYSSARLTLNLRLFRDAAALIGREGSSMIIKHYSDVKPGTYAGTPDGVQVREMITGLDGAPNFSLRVFDVQPGVSTPFHTTSMSTRCSSWRGGAQSERRVVKPPSSLEIRSSSLPTRSIAS